MLSITCSQDIENFVQVLLNPDEFKQKPDWIPFKVSDTIPNDYMKIGR